MKFLSISAVALVFFGVISFALPHYDTSGSEGAISVERRWYNKGNTGNTGSTGKKPVYRVSKSDDDSTTQVGGNNNEGAVSGLLNNALKGGIATSNDKNAKTTVVNTDD
ncbi:hypothetical protein BJV82DRAFT_711562 [Fennellomyces sp. T-0311]|nr:hypothetical protein BJV82DRAFT_711562 [Fennellomyces sp. T-0311]